MAGSGTSSLKSGFTLIELSIVLIVIGLLVGAILTGQDLISAAAQRAQVAQITRYNTAVGTFQGKYGGLPGDLAIGLATQFGFVTTGCNGSTGYRDGNGLIDGYYNGGPGNTTYILQGQQETAMFWQDLSAANLIDSTSITSGAVSGCTNPGNPLSLTPGINYIGNYLPAAKIGQGNFIYVYDGLNAWGLGPNTLGGDNWYGLSAVTSVLVNGGMFSNPALTVAQAYNIDKKIDDGLPVTGNVQAVYLSAWNFLYANPQASDSATSCYNTTTNTYSISIKNGAGLNCAISFQFQQ
jgi:prepilin-type N-terminal cleavage/methylation domain-containing protein